MLITLMALLTACGGDEPEPDPNPNPQPKPDPVPTITASVQSISLPSVGGEQTFTVTCDAGNWSATSSQSWLTVSKQGNTVKVQADASLENSRSAAVELKIGATVMLSVPVSQAKVTEIQSETLAVADLFGTGNNKPLEEYEGVEVTNGHVTAIELPDGNLSGSIPASIGRLTYLKRIDLSGNKLTGSIPVEISNLTKLEYLDLSGNNLSGSIPTFNTSKLVVLDLSENGFTTLASLPQNLPALEYLAFHQNKLQGSLPSQWSGYAHLIYIDVSANAYTGSIPGSWSALTRMRALHLYDNKLSGELPAYLATFSYLESLALHKNDFTGTIPADLGTLPDLESLWLSQNKLTGEIPASLLQNPHWNDWKENVGTQQSGYGFSNYSATKATHSFKTEPSDFGKQLKKVIRKRLETGK